MSGRVTHRIRIRYGYLHQSRAENARRVYQPVKPYRIAHACLDKQRSVIYNFVAINLERIHEDISNLSKAFGIISVVGGNAFKLLRIAEPYG